MLNLTLAIVILASMKPAFVPLPNPIRESEVNLTLNWSADEHTTRAIKRQAKLMGFKSPTAYLLQALAATIAGNEEDTFIGPNGQLFDSCTLPEDAQITH